MRASISAIAREQLLVSSQLPSTSAILRLILIIFFYMRSMNSTGCIGSIICFCLTNCLVNDTTIELVDMAQSSFSQVNSLERFFVWSFWRRSCLGSGESKTPAPTGKFPSVKFSSKQPYTFSTSTMKSPRCSDSR